MLHPKTVAPLLRIERCSPRLPVKTTDSRGREVLTRLSLQLVPRDETNRHCLNVAGEGRKGIRYLDRKVFWEPGLSVSRSRNPYTLVSRQENGGGSQV